PRRSRHRSRHESGCGGPYRVERMGLRVRHARHRPVSDPWDSRQRGVPRPHGARARKQSDRMDGADRHGGRRTMNERNILVVAHAGRDDTVIAARRVVDALRGAGARPVLAPDDRRDLIAVDDTFRDVDALGETISADDLELAIVLGGDGTILRAAELVRDSGAPVLGINMGHVGFLAEIERDDMDDAVRRVIDRDYEGEERLALSVRVKDSDGAVVYETWALNEATVEKASRERMIEVVI